MSYEAIATSLLYAQNSEWMWIFNVLAHYDLPDLSAAAGEHLTKTTLSKQDEKSADSICNGGLRIPDRARETENSR